MGLQSYVQASICVFAVMYLYANWNQIVTVTVTDRVCAPHMEVQLSHSQQTIAMNQPAALQQSSQVLMATSVLSTLHSEGEYAFSRIETALQAQPNPSL